MKTMLCGRVTSILGVILFLAAKAEAASIVFTNTDLSQQLSAKVTFKDLGAGKLEVDLANVYTGNTLDQAHILTGVFFSGLDNLTPFSATAVAGSKAWLQGTNPPVPISAVLGTEWAFATGSGGPTGATEGIVSSGLWSAVGHGNFATPGDMLDGSAYGLISAGYTGGLTDGLPSRLYIQNEIDFILNYTGSINLGAIGHVTFQYGTSFSEPSLAGGTGTFVTPVPEPAPIALVMTSAIVWGMWRARMGTRKCIDRSFDVR